MASILTETDISVLCVTTLFFIAFFISNFVDIRALKNTRPGWWPWKANSKYIKNISRIFLHYK